LGGENRGRRGTAQGEECSKEEEVETSRGAINRKVRDPLIYPWELEKKDIVDFLSISRGETKWVRQQ